MTFDNFQQEIKLEADLQSVEVLTQLWSRIKSLGLEEEEKSNSLVIVYTALMEIYSNFRMYEHRVKKWLDEAYRFGDITSFSYRNAMSHHRLCQDFFNEAKVVKQSLRIKLMNAGINYRKYHPRNNSFNMRKITEYPSNLMFLRLKA